MPKTTTETSAAVTAADIVGSHIETVFRRRFGSRNLLTLVSRLRGSGQLRLHTNTVDWLLIEEAYSRFDRLVRFTEKIITTVDPRDGRIEARSGFRGEEVARRFDVDVEVIPGWDAQLLHEQPRWLAAGLDVALPVFDSHTRDMLRGLAAWAMYPELWERAWRHERPAILWVTLPVQPPQLPAELGWVLRESLGQSSEGWGPSLTWQKAVVCWLNHHAQPYDTTFVTRRAILDQHAGHYMFGLEAYPQRIVNWSHSDVPAWTTCE